MQCEQMAAAHAAKPDDSGAEFLVSAQALAVSGAEQYPLIAAPVSR
jgi:hypothetical protein